MKKAISILCSVLAAALVEAQLPTYVSSSDLVAWYALDGNGDDISGNNRHCSNSNAVSALDMYGNSDGAMYFDGSAEMLSKTFPTSYSAYSYSCWLKADSPWTQGNIQVLPVVQSGTKNSMEFPSFGIAVESKSFKARHRLKNESLNGAAGKGITFDWVHLVNTYDGDSVKLYVNGSLVDKSYCPDMSQFISNFRIGNGVANNSPYYAFGYKGKIDEVGVWSRQLAESEVKDLYRRCYGSLLVDKPLSNKFVSTGDTTTFSLSTNKVPSGYIWQSNAANSGWVNLISPNKSYIIQDSLIYLTDIKVYNHIQRFRVILENGVCPDTSNEATLRVADTCVNLVYDSIDVIVYDTIYTTIIDTQYYGVTDTLYIDAVLSFNNDTIDNKISVYPNPARESIIINTGNFQAMSGYYFEITDLNGKSFHQEFVNEQFINIDLDVLNGAGIYFLMLFKPNNELVETKKLVVK